MLCGQGFHAHFAVGDARGLCFQCVQLGHAQGLGGQVDAQHLRTSAGHGVGQDAPAAAHVEHTFAVQWCQAVDPVQPQGVDFMQGAELAFRVPPAVRQIGELGQFGRIDVEGGVVHARIVQQRGNKKAPRRALRCFCWQRTRFKRRAAGLPGLCVL